jgi:hypothetical protein
MVSLYGVTTKRFNDTLRSLTSQLGKVIVELRLRDKKSAGRPLADL